MFFGVLKDGPELLRLFVARILLREGRTQTNHRGGIIRARDVLKTWSIHPFLGLMNLLLIGCVAVTTVLTCRGLLGDEMRKGGPRGKMMEENLGTIYGVATHVMCLLGNLCGGL